MGTADCFLEQLDIIVFPKPALIGDHSLSIAKFCFPYLAEMASSCTEGLPNTTALRKQQMSLQSPTERLWHPYQPVFPSGCGVHVSISLQSLVGHHHGICHHYPHLILGSLVGRIWHSHCHGLGSIPSQGRGSPTAGCSLFLQCPGADLGVWNDVGSVLG